MRLADATAEDLEAVEATLLVWKARAEKGGVNAQCPMCMLDDRRRECCDGCLIHALSPTSCNYRRGIFGDNPHQGFHHAFPAVRYLSWLRDYLTAYLHNEDLGE